MFFFRISISISISIIIIIIINIAATGLELCQLQPYRSLLSRAQPTWRLLRYPWRLQLRTRTPQLPQTSAEPRMHRPQPSLPCPIRGRVDRTASD